MFHDVVFVKICVTGIEVITQLTLYGLSRSVLTTNVCHYHSNVLI